MINELAKDVVTSKEASRTPFVRRLNGLTAWDCPELVIAGLDLEVAHALLNDLASRIFDKAARFTHGERITDLLAGYDAVIVEGPGTDALHPGAVYARYGAEHVRLQQIVWPDPQGRFPWDAEYALDPAGQPLLARL